MKLSSKRISQLKYKTKHEKEGLCIYCPRIVMKGKICETCHVRICDTMKKRYDRRKELGLCIDCPKETNGKTYCLTCRKRRSRDAKRYRDKHGKIKRISSVLQSFRTDAGTSPQKK